MRPKSYSPCSSYPLRAILRVAVVAALGVPSKPAAEAAHMLACVRPSPRLRRSDVIPQSEPFIMIYNHYDRPGLHAWWGPVLAFRAVAERRVREPRYLRIVITDE
jgi:hypothetical protein